jgi:hypothetical protein
MKGSTVSSSSKKSQKKDDSVLDPNHENNKDEREE